MSDKEQKLYLYKRYSAVRDLRGMKDVDVCRMTGVSQPTMSNWRHGKTIPKVEARKKIADLFGVPVTEFI